ncbi:FAD synthase isoform X1 [Ceratina calcarata]|uniref:FAD synthase n=1 Tax=Ceratina calcarata TaxID=156304 RepID=A0AAJ7WBR8_9HYME|nr:FAD synthase isoform X1 [Ceratina calcarata]
MIVSGRLNEITRRFLRAQYCSYAKMTSLLVPPESVRGMTRLDRDAFTKTVELPYLRFHDIKPSEILPIMKKYLFKSRRFKPVQNADDKTVIYLDPNLITSLDDLGASIKKQLLEMYEQFEEFGTAKRELSEMEVVYTAGLIIIGDEILRGQIVDTNTSYLAKRLRASGIRLRRITVVPDVVDEIAEIVRAASQKYSVVFTSGGVGPTHDDVTFRAIAKGLELKLEAHEELINVYSDLFPNDEEAKRLAIVPRPSELVYVCAPKKYAVVKAKNVYALPGSPKYFQPAVDVILRQLKGDSPMHFEEVDVNLNELSIVKILDEHAERWKGKVNLGSYPQTTEEFTRITLEGDKEDVLQAKAELLHCLPIQKIRNLENGFSIHHARSVLKTAENEPHVESSLNILRQCYKTYKPEEVFISFNGGKDCTVVLHLAACVASLESISSPLLCLYVTAEPFPEVDSFVERAFKYYGLQLVKKESPMRAALTSLLRERPTLKASLMGMRKGDPGSENLQPFSPTDPSWPNLIRVNPILHWTYDHIWKFLLQHNVPYCSLYDEGYTSLGTKSTTIPNPRLRDPKDSSSYLPAYTLTDESAERQGRV